MDAEIALLNVKSILNKSILFKFDVSFFFFFYIITESVTKKAAWGESSLRSLASGYEIL